MYLEWPELREIGNSNSPAPSSSCQTRHTCGQVGHIHQHQTFLSSEILTMCILWQSVLVKGGNRFQAAKLTLFFQKWREIVWTIWRPTAARSPYLRVSLGSVPFRSRHGPCLRGKKHSGGLAVTEAHWAFVLGTTETRGAPTGNSDGQMRGPHPASSIFCLYPEDPVFFVEADFSVLVIPYLFVLLIFFMHFCFPWPQ